MTRFDAIKYDEKALRTQNESKEIIEALEKYVDTFVQNGRAKSLALTALEEAYMWIGKAIRDDQIKRYEQLKLKSGGDK